VSDAPRDPDDDDTPTGEISIGRGAGGGPDARDAGGHADELAAGGDPDESVAGARAGGGDLGADGGTASAVPDATGAGTGTGASAGASAGDAPSGAGGRPAAGRRAARRLLSFGPLPTDSGDPRQRRRRRWFVWGIAIAAAIVVIALCAGALSVVSAVNGVRDRAADARAARALRENDCLDLEKRLNRLVPPGSTTGPAARATAIRDENAAVRIYVGQLNTQRDEDAWRQLLDARTVFADALDRQAKSRTPAFFVAPRTDNGSAVADELVQWSPAPCAGAIRRLAAPEL